MRRIVIVCLLWLSFVGEPASAAESGVDAAWRALRAGGHVAVLRHALAPGTGDPPGFRLDDCSTQRTLSAEGKRQARRLGDAFRGQGVAVEAVYSSRWCRCLETADLLDLAPTSPLPLLDSFFEDRGRAAEQTAALRDWLAERRSAGTLVLVSHQVNITQLTGVFPASGEIVVVRPDTDGAVTVVGRIPPPP